MEEITKYRFDKLILKSVYTLDHIIPGTTYFDKAYETGFKEFLCFYSGGNGMKRLFNWKKEFKPFKNGSSKICSVGSGTRLGLLYFANNHNLISPYPTGEMTPPSFTTTTGKRLKVCFTYYSFDTHTNFKCICNEVLNEKCLLKMCWYDYLKPLFINKVKHDDYNMHPTFSDIGLTSEKHIKLLGKIGLTPTDYIYSMHLDVGHLLREIMSLMKYNMDNIDQRLQYIYFTPKEEYLSMTKQLYETLKVEIELIKDSYPIRYAREHSVFFLDPQFISVDSIFDHALIYTRNKNNDLHFLWYDKTFDDLFNKFTKNKYVPTMSELLYKYKLDEEMALHLIRNIRIASVGVSCFPEVIANKAREYGYLTGLQVNDIDSEYVFCSMYRVCRNIASKILESYRTLYKEIGPQSKYDMYKDCINPKLPFNIKTIVQEAYNRLSLKEGEVAVILTNLRKGVEIKGEKISLITIPNNLTYHLSDEFLKRAREYMKDRFGEESVAKKISINVTTPSLFPNHEAIRPTSIHRTPSMVKDFLNENEFKLYELIYNRTIECLMPNIKADKTILEEFWLGYAKGDYYEQ